MTNYNLMAELQPVAFDINQIDEEIKMVNERLKDLKSRRAQLEDKAIGVMQTVGVETSIGLPGGGHIKLETKLFPQVKDLNGFISWAKDKSISLPQMQFNPSTIQAWYREQVENSLPVPPPDLVGTFNKTKVKVKI